MTRSDSSVTFASTWPWTARGVVFLQWRAEKDSPCLAVRPPEASGTLREQPTFYFKSHFFTRCTSREHCHAPRHWSFQFSHHTGRVHSDSWTPASRPTPSTYIIGWRCHIHRLWPSRDGPCALCGICCAAHTLPGSSWNPFIGRYYRPTASATVFSTAVVASGAGGRS